MACDNFLQFTEAAIGTNLKGGSNQPKGETKDVAHKDWLEVKTFEFGCENPTTIGSATGGAGAGKFKLQPFKVTKDVDKASAPLFMACAAGAHYPTLKLSIRKAGGQQKDYLTYIFRMVYVTNISWSGGGGEEAPEETVEFVYGAMGIKYFPQKPDGSMDAPLMSQWSQTTNQPNLEVVPTEPCTDPDFPPL
jgi:type VI secretion system secreted protein Hcp